MSREGSAGKGQEMAASSDAMSGDCGHQSRKGMSESASMRLQCMNGDSVAFEIANDGVQPRVAAQSDVYMAPAAMASHAPVMSLTS